MVIAALERRGEIELRLALGARSGQIASQFLTEAAILALFGGIAGVVIGALIVVGYSASKQGVVVLPVEVLVVRRRSTHRRGDRRTLSGAPRGPARTHGGAPGGVTTIPYL